ADVILERVGHGGQDPVVLLPAEELLEPEELSDLQVHDAEVVDALVGSLGKLERMDRQVRDPVVDDPLAAELLDSLGQRVTLRREVPGDDVRVGGGFGPPSSSTVFGS